MGVNVKEQLKMMGPRGEIVIEDFDEFAARRRLDNIAHNMSECNFSRQTGRSSRMLFEAMRISQNTHVCVVCHSDASCKQKKRIYGEICSMNIANADLRDLCRKNVRFSTASKYESANYRASEDEIALFDNVMEDIEVWAREKLEAIKSKS